MREREVHGLTVTVDLNGQGKRILILNNAVCISQSANNLGRGMNLIILPPAKDKCKKDWALYLSIANALDEEYHWIQTN